MIILQARFGYIYHNKKNDTYHERVCLPNKKRIDDYEEVPREDIDFEVYQRITTLQDENKVLKQENKILQEKNIALEKAKDELVQKSNSLTKVAKIVANDVTDDIVALQIQEFYDEWTIDINVVVGQYLLYQDVLYKVLTQHTTQESWTPDVASSLFAKVLADPTGETVLDWEQPDSTNPYMKGDKVLFEGVTYISTVDNNVWQPGVYGWEVV